MSALSPLVSFKRVPFQGTYITVIPTALSCFSDTHLLAGGDVEGAGDIAGVLGATKVGQPPEERQRGCAVWA
jgi:hypothetical protein